jgi:hypothetical protein
LIILLAGGTKRRQQRNIEAARALWQEYRRRKRRERLVMALSEDVNVTIRARMKRDPALCREVLKEAIAVLLGGEVDVGKTLLRNYVIARFGFDELSRLTGKAPQSLMRMLSRTGNPQARNFFEVIRVLQEHEGVQADVRFKRRPAEAATAR